MSKDTFYFPHDYNARSDPKIKKLLSRHGYKGYGVYWGLIEDLYNNNNCAPYDIETLAYDFREDDAFMKSILNDFDLFTIDSDQYMSEAVRSRLIIRDEKSKKYSNSAKSRWAKSLKEYRMDCPQFYAIKCYSGDEEFIKIGITSEYISRRYSGKLPYEYDVILQVFSENYMELEGAYNKLLGEFLYTPNNKFGGSNECYSIDCVRLLDSNSINIDNKKYINTIASHYNLNATTISRNAIKESKANENKANESKGKDTKETEGDKPPVFNFKNSLLDYGFNKEFVKDWMLVRKNKKATDTETAYNSFIIEIEKTGLEKNDVLKLIIEKDWKGFKAEWIKEKNDDKDGRKQNKSIEDFEYE